MVTAVKLLFQVALVLSMAAVARAGLPEAGKWRLSTDGEYISLEANQVPLARLVRAINEFTPAEIDMDDLPDRNVTLRYQSIPIGDLLAKLNVSYVLTYARDAGAGDFRLESAWVGHFAAQPGAGAVAPGLAAPAGPGGVVAALPAGGIAKAMGYQTAEAVRKDVGVVHRVPFPLVMKVDGDVSDWPADMPWHEVAYTANRLGTPVDVGGTTNDADASMKFASTADQTNLYMAVKIRDDKKVLDRSEADDAENNDSLVISIGGVTNIIRRHNIWRVNEQGDVVGSGRQIVSLNNDTSAVVVDGSDGWEVELQVRHNAVGLQPESAPNVPFDIWLNDDDDGGERDTQIRWSWAASTAPSSPPQLILQDLVQ
jgi:hypothetical protein